MAITRALKVALLVVAAVIVTVLLGAWILLETHWGMQRVREFALGLVNDRIPGEIRVARIDGPGLLGGLRLYDIVVLDPDGEPVLRMDSARVSYDWRSFLKRRPVLDAVVLSGAEARLAKEPGQARFGLVRAFVAEAPPDTTSSAGGMPIELRDVRIVGTTLLVRQPVEREPAEASRFVEETVPGGRVRIMRFDAISARLESVLIGGGDARVDVRLSDGSLVGRVLHEPFTLTRVRGRATLRDSVLTLNLPVVELADTRVGVRGGVTLGKAGTGLDLNIDGRDIALKDLRWVDARVPDGGTVAGEFKVVTIAGGYDIDGDAITARIDGSKLSARGGLRLTDRMRLRNVDVALSPLESATVESFLPERELPVEGRITGRVAADGTLDNLVTRGDLIVRPRGSASSARLRWSGGASVMDETMLRDLTVEVDSLDATVLAAFAEALELRGLIDARFVANGPLRRGIALDGALTHRLPGVGNSTVGVTGTLGYTDQVTSLDLQLRLQPLRLQVLAPLSPRLATLDGTATGTLQLEGTPNDLSVDGTVQSEADRVTTRMRLLRQPRLRFEGTATLFRFRPIAVLSDLPDASITGGIDFDVNGTDPAELAGFLRARLDSASIAQVVLGPVQVDGRMGDGLLHVDTLVADGPGFVLRADGSIGITESASGTLQTRLAVSSLQPLERFLFEEESADPTIARVDGRGTATARLDGSIAALALDANATFEHVRWQEQQVHGLTLRATGAGLGGDSGRLLADARADSAVVFGHRTDSTWVTGRLADGAWRVEAYAGIDGRDKIRADVELGRDGEALTTRIAALTIGDGASAWRLAEPAIVIMDGPTITVDSVGLVQGGAAGRFAANGRIVRIAEEGETPDSPLDFTATLETVPLGELVRFASFESAVQGSVNGRLTLRGTPQSPIIAGDLAVTRFALDDAALDSLGGRIAYANRRLEVRTQGYRDGRRLFFGEGRVPIDLRLGATTDRRLAEELDFSFQADSMPARFMLGFVDAFRDVEGMLDGQVSARGTTRTPQLSGAFALRQGAATLSEIGVRYRNVVGVFNFERDMNVQVDLSARAAPASAPNDLQGSFRVTGDMDLSRPLNPGFDLEVQAQSLLAARRRDMEVTASGRVQIDGEYESPILSGSIRINRGTLNLDELYRQYLVVGLEDPLLFDVVDTSLVAVKRVLPESENPFLKNLRLRDFDVTVEPGTWLRSREMNVELTGDLNVVFVRQAEDLRITGSLRTIRGTYRLEYPGFSRVFDVREGTVEFPGTPGMNPNLNVTALYRVRTQSEPLDIYARVTGTLESPRVTLESGGDVAISESDLASYLFFGVPSYAIGSGGSGRSRSPLGDLGFVTASTFGYLSAGLQSLAQSIGLVDYIGVTTAESSGGRESGIGGLIENTQIQLGRYLTPELFVIWTQRLGTGSTSGADVKLEWRIARNLTAEFYAEDRFARTPSFGLSQIANARRVFGFFLFREWGY